MINSVVLVGRLANDPELRYTPSGTPIATFRLAVDRGRKGDDGKQEVDWLNVVAFTKTAELAAQYLDKGALAGIEGRIQSRSWEGQDGKRQYSVEIIANNIRFLESKSEAERRRGGPKQGSGNRDIDDIDSDAGGWPADLDDPFGDM